MKKLNKVGILLLLVLFTQCVLTKKQKNNFLKKYCIAKDSTSYTRKDSIVYIDSLIQVPYIINQPVYLENPCAELCDSTGKLKPFYKTKSSKGLKSTVQSVGNSIVFNCETDSLKARIKWLEHHIKIQSSKVQTQYVACTEPHQTKFTGFTFWWFWITAAIIAVYISLRIFASYIKFK